MRRTLRSCLFFGLGLGVAVALGTTAVRAGDPARDLGDIEPTPSGEIDDSNTATSQDVDQVLGEGAEDPDIVDSGDPDAQVGESGEAQETEGTPLSEADRSPEWAPPPCESIEVDLGSRPPAKDSEAWRGELQDAEADVQKTRTLLAAADSEYGYARNAKSPRGDALKQIIDARDKARVDYALARCSLPARVEEARRLGVLPEVWRDFPPPRSDLSGPSGAERGRRSGGRC